MSSFSSVGWKKPKAADEEASPNIRIQARGAAARLRRSRSACPGSRGGDASAEERVACHSELEESTNKKLSGQSCHTTGHARL